MGVGISQNMMEILAKNFGESITNWTLKDSFLFCCFFSGREARIKNQGEKGHFKQIQ